MEKWNDELSEEIAPSKNFLEGMVFKNIIPYFEVELTKHNFWKGKPTVDYLRLHFILVNFEPNKSLSDVVSLTFITAFDVITKNHIRIINMKLYFFFHPQEKEPRILLYL